MYQRLTPPLKRFLISSLNSWPIDQGGKATLPEIVKSLDQGSKAALPESSIKHPINHQLTDGDAAENKAASHRTAAKKMGDGVDMVLSGLKKPGEIDLSEFPEDVIPLLQVFLEYFPLNAPKRSSNRKPGEFGQWIGESRALLMEMREFGGSALEIIREACAECSSLTVTHPGAILNTTRSVIAKHRLAVRAKENKPKEPQWTSEQDAKWEEFLNRRDLERKQKNKEPINDNHAPLVW